MTRIIAVILITLLVAPSASAGPRRGKPINWDPGKPINSDPYRVFVRSL